MPTSRMKEEIARILKDEGYIKDFRVVEADAGRPTLVDRAEVRPRTASASSPTSSASPSPGRRVYARQGPPPARARRARHRDHVHLDRRDHEPPGRRARRRRRGASRSSGSACQPNRKQSPSSFPSGVTRRVSPGARAGERARSASSTQRVPPRMQIEQDDGAARRRRARPSAARIARCTGSRAR